MNKTELAVIIPTRGRPGNIAKVISAWDFTNAWDVADLVLAVDQDDPEIEGYRALSDEFVQGCPPGTPSPLTLIEIPVWQPMAHKLNAAALALADDYFALGFAGDDHLPQTIGWAKTYLTALHELGTGMVYGDDGYQGKKLSTEWAVTADAVRALGRMVPAPVEHMYSDNSIMELFDEARAIRHLPQVRIEHLNPYANGKAPMDAQYKRVNSREQYKKDGDAYRGWKSGQMSADLATLKALRPNRPWAPRKERRMSGRSPFPRHFKQVPGATPEEIGIALADFAAQVPRDQAIVELGVYRGRTALQMAWGAQQGNGAHVTAIDAWDLPGNTYGPPFTDPGTRSWARYWVQSLGYANHITLVHGFSSEQAALWVTSPEEVGLGNRPVGLLFVDDDHSYEGARGAILAWVPHLAEGARIAIDDYGHPDWPGVARAVDDLVNEGVLAPIEIFHERLAVTRLATGELQTTAITGEGVSPSPTTADLEAEWERVDPEGVAALRESAAKLDTQVSSQEPGLRVVVSAGELDGVAEGTSISELTIPQMKALAKVRGIVLGARKDKRELILKALQDGR